MLERYRTPAEGTEADLDLLEAELARLQQRIRAAGVPVVILFEGWGASGKGRMIARLIRALDPRGFKVYTTGAPTGEELRYPPMRRYWLRMPARGQIAIFDRSWYRAVSVDWVEGLAGKRKQSFAQIENLERAAAADGAVLLKFFLHISAKEQKRRFEKLEADPATSWRVTKADWRHHRHYDAYYRAFDEMLERTDFAFAPWRVVNGEDRAACAATVLRTVIAVLEAALAAPQAPAIPAEPSTMEPAPSLPPLREVDLERTLDPEDYSLLLKQGQERLFALHNALYRRRIPLILVYEGWDAAGKGGNIKRLTRALDPRGYEVVPIAAPDSAEKSRHYLWRFWNALPRDGHIAIFDRSWYGRVMVERIEGFCTEADWRRAYDEINRFEGELADWGAIILKFWLQIDREEQLVRFTQRQNNPEKRWKITQEDWRNREKWDAYEVAVDEMLRRTHTAQAPWLIVESNDKRFARIKTINAAIAAIERRL